MKDIVKMVTKHPGLGLAGYSEWPGVFQGISLIFRDEFIAMNDALCMCVITGSW